MAGTQQCMFDGWSGAGFEDGQQRDAQECKCGPQPDHGRDRCGKAADVQPKMRDVMVWDSRRMPGLRRGTVRRMRR